MKRIFIILIFSIVSNFLKSQNADWSVSSPFAEDDYIHKDHLLASGFKGKIKSFKALEYFDAQIEFKRISNFNLNGYVKSDLIYQYDESEENEIIKKGLKKIIDLNYKYKFRADGKLLKMSNSQNKIEIVYNSNGMEILRLNYYDNNLSSLDSTKYNEFGKINEIKLVNSSGNIKRSHRFDYDKNGNLQSEEIIRIRKRKRSSGEGNQLIKTTKKYDLNNHSILEENFADNYNSSEFKLNSSKFTKYNINNQKIEEIEYTSIGKIESKIEYKYDEQFKLLEIKQYDSSNLLVLGEFYDYNANGYIAEIRKCDSLGKVVSTLNYLYDKFGNISKMYENKNLKFECEYTYFQ